jgi:Lsr2
MKGIEMAQKVQVSFVDDIDGSDAEGTVRFALDGADYEIDLNTGHADELRKAFATYVEHGRKVSGVRRAGRGSRRTTASGLNTTEVRDWAKSQGIQIKERGRVPADVLAKYREATGK